VAGKKGRVMERRLLKDFQIGMVEGIVKEAISSEKEPKDVFSKIARAIGRRTSSQSQKKDWNAMVRRSTMVRDPIGSTTEAQVRRSRQSLRRYIIENQAEAFSSMDPEKLIEYNPKLSLVSPAARVAYAKFKMSKIKQEYDKRAADGDGESTKGEETQAQQPTSETGEAPAEASTAPTGSIVRPRPRASTKREAPGLPPPPSTNEPKEEPPAPLVTMVNEKEKPADTLEPEASAPRSLVGSLKQAKDFRSRTPIPEDPHEDEQKHELHATGSQTEVQRKVRMFEEKSKEEEEKPKADEEEEEKEEEEEEKPSKSASPPRARIAPSKPGGRSIVTGEILQGWL